MEVANPFSTPTSIMTWASGWQRGELWQSRLWNSCVGGASVSLYSSATQGETQPTPPPSSIASLYFSSHSHAEDWMLDQRGGGVFLASTVCWNSREPCALARTKSTIRKRERRERLEERERYSEANDIAVAPEEKALKRRAGVTSRDTDKDEDTFISNILSRMMFNCIFSKRKM